MATLTYNRNVRSLLTSTSLAVNASKSVTSISRSSTTATASATSHGFSAGDWVLIQGANYPEYNGLHQVVTVADANTFTYTIERDPGANASGTLTAIKGSVTSVWGDGSTTLSTGQGYQGALTNVGALPSACPGSQFVARVATASAPGYTSGLGFIGFTSSTGYAGTWRRINNFGYTATTTANDQTTIRLDLPPGAKFAIGLLAGVTGNAVIWDCVGEELTSATVA